LEQCTIVHALIISLAKRPKTNQNLFETLQFCLFICQVVLVRKQRSDLFGLRVKLPPVTIS